jgi:phosphate transport system ATP-binding protein
MLRTFNRMNDLVEGARTAGSILVDGRNIGCAGDLSDCEEVGMVFPAPNPFHCP